MSFIYEKIVDDIRGGIESGIFERGDKLPSLRSTAAKYNCSVSVAIQAYSELECQGIVESVEKSGYFVLPSESGSIPQPQVYDHDLSTLITKSNNLTDDIIKMAADSDILPFGAAIPDSSILETKRITKYLTRYLKESPDCLSSYTPGQGAVSLREELSRYMFKRGVNVNSDDIVITNGCAEALYLAIEASTNEGDIVAIESPVFFSVISMLEILKRKVVEIPTSPTTGMNLDVLDSVSKSSSVKAVIYSPTFQNPLCYSMTNSDKVRLYDIACRNDIMLIEDDIYGDCSFDNKISNPVKSFDSEDRVLYCSSFSKTLAPGLRLGWIIPSRFKDYVCNKKTNSGLGGSALIHESIAMYLKSGSYDYHLKSFRKKILQQTYGIKKLVLKYFPEDIKVTDPNGGYFLWIEFNSNFDSYKLFSEALKVNIGIVPGPVFSVSKKYRNCIRISCGSPLTVKIEEGIKSLGEIARNI